jgi:hypothetical protein
VAATFTLHDRVLSNRRSRRLYESAPAALDDRQQRIVDEVRRNGYAA